MQNWKTVLGTLALGAVTISPFVADGAFAKKNKSDTTKTSAKKAGDTPVEPTAAEVEQGQKLDKGPRWPNKARQAGEPTGPTKPTAAEIEQGQLLDKGPRWKPSVSAGSQPTEPTPAEVEQGQKLIKNPHPPIIVMKEQPTEPTAAEIEQGQKLDKGPRPPIKAMDAADNDLCGVPYTPPCRSDAAKAKKPSGKISGLRGSGVIVAVLVGAGTIAALVVASGGNDAPTSP